MISFLAIPWIGGMKRGFGLYFVGGRVVEQSRSSELPFLLVSTLKNVSFSFSEDLRRGITSQPMPVQPLPPPSRYTMALLYDVWTHTPMGGLL